MRKFMILKKKNYWATGEQAGSEVWVLEGP